MKMFRDWYRKWINISLSVIKSAKINRIMKPEEGKMKICRLTLGCWQNKHPMEAIYFGDLRSLQVGEFRLVNQTGKWLFFILCILYETPMNFCLRSSKKLLIHLTKYFFLRFLSTESKHIWKPAFLEKHLFQNIKVS